MKQKITKITPSPYEKIEPRWNKPYTQIYLIRHCEPDRNFLPIVGDPDMPLSASGKKQLVYLTKKLKTMGIERIYSSEYRRALETAEPLAHYLKKTMVVEPRLNEIDWHDWHKVKYFHMTEKTREKKFIGYKKMDHHLDQYQIKARRMLADIFEHNKHKKIAIFCHGNIIRTIITSIINSDIIGFLSMEVYQSSITKLTIDKSGYVKINYLNNISHLPHHTQEDLFLAGSKKK